MNVAESQNYPYFEEGFEKLKTLRKFENFFPTLRDVQPGYSLGE